MHHGYIVAACVWPELGTALEAFDGPFREIARATEAPEDVVHVVELGDATYLLEESTILSADADLVVRLSEELACRVVGTGAETVSGTVWFTTAEAGDAKRVYFDIRATLTQPFQHGEPLPSEQVVPWGDLDGQAQRSALAAFGFSPEPLDRLWHSRERFAASDRPSEAIGRFGAAINEHVQRFETPNADDWHKNIKVVARDGGFDLVAMPPKRSRLSRWFRRSPG